MGLLLAFAPFVVFAILSRFIGPAYALAIGPLVSGTLIARDWKRPKILEVGTFVLFAALAAYMATLGAALSVIAVRLCVDAGLLIIVLISMAVGRPFTLQYARERVAPELWTSPQFLKVNYVLTSVWAAAFAVMVIAELGLLFVSGLPRNIGVGAIVLALVGAFKFTAWYPDYVRRARSAAT